jgi:hypothetical protein
MYDPWGLAKKTLTNGAIGDAYSLARIMLTLELRITNANDVAGCLALDEAQGMVGCTLPESTEVEATFLRPNGRVSGT